MTLFSLRRRASAPLLVAVVAVAAALGGCATSALPRSTVAVAPYRDQIELAGGIAIHYVRDGKQASLTGQFSWQQSASATDVSLISPTGQTLAILHVTPAAATLTQSGKAPLSAPDLDSLSTQTLGWTLPVSGLRDWLQGYATDAAGQPFVASPAHDSVVTRDGWKVEYMSWQDGVAGAARPKLIYLTRLGAGQVDEMTIRIAIRPTTE